MRTALTGAIPVVLLSVCLFAGCQQAGPQASAGAALRVGSAEMDITPPVGYRMAGYFVERLSTGIHDPLHAKAIVIQQGPRQVALVACDLIGFSLNVTTNARARASKLTGIPVSNIVICATHSHTGPLFDGPLREYFHETARQRHGDDPQEKVDYPAFLVERLAGVIVEAQGNLRPARLQAGVAKQEGLSFNRRYWMKNGQVQFNPGPLNPDIVRPAGPIDPDVGMLLARGKDEQQPFAGLTVFAVHSDTVGGTEYSADYAYFLQQALRRAFGKDFISAFGLGTCGDLNHINVNEKPATRRKFADTERIGGALAQGVIERSKSLPFMSNPSLAARSASVQVPFQQATPEQVAAARKTMESFNDTNVSFLVRVAAVRTLDLAGRGPLYPMEVQVFRLDTDTAIVCLPCEIFVELGLAIKKASLFKQTLVIEICNDRPSYVPTLKAFAEGSYEVTNARVKPGAGEILVNTAVKLLGELKSE